MSVGGLILLLIISISIFVMTTYADSWNYKITCNGKWKIKLKKNTITKVSASELINGLESDRDEVELTIKTKIPNPDWKVTVKRIDGNWPDGLDLYIKRTGDRQGIDGGQQYAMVSNTETDFFMGELDEAKKIPIQFKLTGLGSVLFSLTPPANIETEIVYTVTEDLAP